MALNPSSPTTMGHPEIPHRPSSPFFLMPRSHCICRRRMRRLLQLNLRPSAGITWAATTQRAPLHEPGAPDLRSEIPHRPSSPFFDITLRALAMTDTSFHFLMPTARDTVSDLGSHSHPPWPNYNSRQISCQPSLYSLRPNSEQRASIHPP